MPNPVLPTFVRFSNSYSIQKDRGMIRSKTELGLAKQKPRYTSPIITRNVELIILSDDFMMSFLEWYDINLNGGMGWFQFLDPFFKATTQGRFVNILSWSAVATDAWQAFAIIESI